jgi:general secretion pathway protein E/type IV pilus assembly protein PilB
MAEVSLARKPLTKTDESGARASGRDIDLRVSVLPTVYGESIVMRILDKEGLKLGLPELGFFADDQAKFQSLISGSDGAFSLQVQQALVNQRLLFCIKLY